MDFSNITKIVQWNSKKGFGFAEAKNTKYFFHISSIMATRTPRVGDRILVETFGKGPKGPRIEKGTLDENIRRNRKKKKKSKADKKILYIMGILICIVLAIFLGLFNLIEKNTDDYPEIQNPPSITIPSLKINFNKTYSTKDEVANYICQFGGLPKNYVAKHKGKALFEKRTGKTFDKWNFNPLTTIGVMIGGDYYSNTEYQLPMGHWLEADIDYTDSSRGTKRLVYNSSCSIYYTNNHFKNFSKIRFQ